MCNVSEEPTRRTLCCGTSSKRISAFLQRPAWGFSGGAVLEGRLPGVLVSASDEENKDSGLSGTLASAWGRSSAPRVAFPIAALMGSDRPNTI